jgi:hypothetical protein
MFGDQASGSAIRRRLEHLSFPIFTDSQGSDSDYFATRKKKQRRDNVFRFKGGGALDKHGCMKQNAVHHVHEQAWKIHQVIVRFFYLFCFSYTGLPKKIQESPEQDHQRLMLQYMFDTITSGMF